MATIIRPAQDIRIEEHRRDYALPAYPGSAFSFPCDRDGYVDVAALTTAARANYVACLAGSVDGQPVVDQGVVDYSHTYRAPAMLRCACGDEVPLDGFTNPCLCGRDYNFAGQLLAPRSQWGEETGETAGEILMADADAYARAYDW